LTRRKAGARKTITDRRVLALASPALRRDILCPTPFRQAKRVNEHRVSQKTIERLISEGSCAGQRQSNIRPAYTTRTGHTRHPGDDETHGATVDWGKALVLRYAEGEGGRFAPRAGRRLVAIASMCARLVRLLSGYDDTT
jgi:hypothetical protein